MARKRKGNARFSALRAKPPLYWVLFGAGALLVAFTAWLGFAHAVASITWQKNADLALRFVPDHPLALSRKADELFAQGQDAETLARVEKLARQSLRGGALNPVAVRLLGFVADSRGDREKARSLMQLSHRLSRRDFGTQLWLIEDAVARGDKPQALYHYDVAMRTTPSSHAILFPTLIGALADPEVRTALVPYVRRAPAWLVPFLGEAINTGNNPANLAEILIKSGGLPDSPEYRDLSNSLLVSLTEKGNLPAFRRYYLSLPGSKMATLQTIAPGPLTVNLSYPAAGWRLFDSAAVGGGFTAPDKEGAQTLTAFAGSGERAEMMRKILFLGPGQYRFQARYSALESAPAAEIRWDMSCLKKPDQTGVWFTVDRVKAGPSGSSHILTIPAECPHQLLTLQLAGGSSQAGMEFTLRSLSLTRI